MRHREGLTQQQLAELLNTKKSNISRLESISSSISPKLSTISDYAEALAYSLKIDVTVNKQANKKHRQQRAS